MSDPDVLRTKGTTVTVGGATFTRVTDVTTGSQQVTEIDVTCMESDEKEYIAGLVDRGEFTVTVQIGAGGAAVPSSDGTAEAWAIAGDGVSFSGLGFIKAAPAKAGVDGIWTQDITVRITGSGA